MTNYADAGGYHNLREAWRRPDFYSVVPDSILLSVYCLEFFLVVSNSTPRSFYSKLNCLQLVGFLIRCLILQYLFVSLLVGHNYNDWTHRNCVTHVKSFFLVTKIVRVSGF